MSSIVRKQKFCLWIFDSYFSLEKCLPIKDPSVFCCFKVSIQSDETDKRACSLDISCEVLIVQFLFKIVVQFLNPHYTSY